MVLTKGKVKDKEHITLRCLVQAGPCHVMTRLFKDFNMMILEGRRPQFRLLAKYIHKTVRTDADRARCDWLLLMIKY